MTEVGAAIGIEQLKKLETIKLEQARRYDILRSRLENFYPIRPIALSSTPLKDCLIVEAENFNLRNRLLEVLADSGVGTKNLPDAMQWHFAGNWPLILEKSKYCDALLNDTRKRLEACIAIPIFCKIGVDAYESLGERLVAEI